VQQKIIMKNTLWILLLVIWILSLAILIIAITDLFPENPFKKHTFIIGMGFIAFTGFIKIIYKKMKI